MVRPLNAAIVSSTNPDSFSVSEWIITWMSWASATDKQQSIAAGVVPGPRRAGGREGAGGRPGSAAQHRGDAAHQRLLDLLRADEMDVAVEAARGEDFPLARDHVGAGTDHNGDIGLN